jgi:short-subunit dehydrogenase
MSGLSIVTGASSGIGAAVADRLAREGHRLLLVGRHAPRLEAVARRTGGEPLLADLADPAAIELVRARGSGPVRLVVHAAGIGSAGPLAEIPAADIAALTAVNLVAPMQLTAALLPGLLAADGRIAFVASIAALGVADEAVYSATKAGLRGFADALRLETGLVVTTVLPGAVATPFFANRGTPYARRFPRPLPPERVADALVDAVERGRAEVFVPRWLAAGARVHGGAPSVFARLSRRFGGALPRRPVARDLLP